MASRRVNVDLTMRIGTVVTDEEVAQAVERAVLDLREHGFPVETARVRRVATEEN